MAWAQMCQSRVKEVRTLVRDDQLFCVAVFGQVTAVQNSKCAVKLGSLFDACCEAFVAPMALRERAFVLILLKIYEVNLHGHMQLREAV